jgi:hypothetical protein
VERVSILNVRGGTRIFVQDTLEIQFACKRADGTIDNSYTGTLRLRHIGNGKIIGDTIAQVFSGIATYRLAFSRAGMHVLKAENAELVGVAGDSIRVEHRLVALKYPKVIKVPISNEPSSLPFVALLQLNALEPNAGTELEFVIMVIAVSCVKLLSAHNSTQHTSRKHKV